MISVYYFTTNRIKIIKAFLHLSSHIVFNLKTTHSLSYLPGDIISIERNTLSEVIRELYSDSNEQNLKFRKNGISFRTVPWLDEYSVIWVKAKVSLEVIHNKSSRQMPAQHRYVLQWFSHHECQVISIQSVSDEATFIDRIYDLVCVLFCSSCKHCQLVVTR
jgi:hypothetical protein